MVALELWCRLLFSVCLVLNNILFIISYIHAYIQTIHRSDGKHSAYVKVISSVCLFEGLSWYPLKK